MNYEVVFEGHSHGFEGQVVVGRPDSAGGDDVIVPVRKSNDFFGYGVNL